MTSASASLSVVIPVFPVVRGLGRGGVSVEDEGDETAEEVVGMSVTIIFCDAFEGGDPSDGLDNKPEIRQRLRAFHIV